MAVRYCNRHKQDCLFCNATSKRTGKPCGQHVEPGEKVCDWHGGKAPQTKRKTEQRQALATAQHEAESLLARPEDRDPLDHMAEVLSRAQTTAMALRLVMEHDRTTAGDSSGLIVLDRHGVFQAHPLLAECRMWEAQAATMATNMTKGGIAERQTRISELQLTMLAQRVQGLFTEAGINPHTEPYAALIQRWLSGEMPTEAIPPKEPLPLAA